MTYLLVKNLVDNFDTIEFKECTKNIIQLVNWLLNEMKNPSRSVKAAYSTFKKDFNLNFAALKSVIDEDITVIAENKLSIQKFLLNKNNGKYQRHYDYNNCLFKELMLLETELILRRNKKLFSLQLYIAAFKLLLDYFYWNRDTITGEEWVFNVQDICDICNDILEMSVSELTGQVKDKINRTELENSINEGLRNMNKEDEDILKILGKKPHCAECLTQLWKDEEGLSQADKMKLVMYRYDCSKATAIRYMKKFGLWVSREEKKSSMSEVEKLRLENLRLKKLLKENNINF